MDSKGFSRRWLSLVVLCVVCAPAGASDSKTGKAGIEWVTIPGGSFVMGSAAKAKTGAFDDELPLHKVTIKSFELAKAPVTFRQYRACVDAGVCRPPYPECLTKKFMGDDQPVVCVDWYQARVFSQWVGGRLPSESEWEYAARSAGKYKDYPWGSEKPTCDRVVMAHGCDRGVTWPVCSKPKGNTEQGVCDMIGNVWQWVQDIYRDSYDRAPVDGSSWEQGPGGGVAGDTRCSRGGSWSNGADIGYLRATDRDYLPVGTRSWSVGFRPARSLP